MPTPNTDLTQLRDALDGQEAGRAIHALIRDLYPICRSITGDGMRQTLARLQEGNSDRGDRGSQRHPGVRLDSASRMEHPRRLCEEFERRTGHRFPPPQPARGELQRPGAGQDVAGPAAAPPAHPARSAGLDPLSHFLLQGGLGLLPAPPPTGADARGRIRGLHRLHAAGRALDVRRMPAEGSLGAGSACLLPRLPSVLVQRQPVGHRRRHLPGQTSGPAAAALLLPLPVHPWDHRLDHLAQPE